MPLKSDFAPRRRKLSPAAAAERQRHRAALASVTADCELRRAAIFALVKSGDLRVCEASRILGVTDRTVRRWCKAANVKPKQARAALLARLSKVAPLFAPAFDQMMRERGVDAVNSYGAKDNATP
jgi:hypothetical protein